jgi:predicted O-methyltransferase YrrM
MRPAGYIPDATDLDFIDSVTPDPEPGVLALEADGLRDRLPIVDRATGHLLRALAHGRPRIVDVGTAIGYSALWLALGAGPEGRVVTIDPDAGRTARARGYWQGAGIGDERIVVVGMPALDAFAADVPELRGPFDLAFIDALKPEYAAYVEALVPRLAPGALLLADNVLYGGMVAGRSGFRADVPSEHRNAEALRVFDAAILADPRFVSTILPMCDGILLATYVGDAA